MVGEGAAKKRCLFFLSADDIGGISEVQTSSAIRNHRIGVSLISGIAIRRPFTAGALLLYVCYIGVSNCG
jgi:hypothetical protein